MSFLQRIIASSSYEKIAFNKTLYHGSTKEIKNFDVETGGGKFGKGLYLTKDLKTAQFYAAGGRQGSAGQRIKEGSGFIYEFKVQGPCIKILDIEETMGEVVENVEEAEEAFDYTGERTHPKVAKYVGPWAEDFENCNIVWFAEKNAGVLTAFDQVLITNNSVIKSTKLYRSSKT